MHWKIHPPRPSRFPKGGDFAPLGPRDCPRAISRASGCKIPALGKSLGPRGVYFPIHPSSRQCTDTLYNSQSIRLQWWYTDNILQHNVMYHTTHSQVHCNYDIMIQCNGDVIIQCNVGYNSQFITLHWWYYTMQCRIQQWWYDNAMQWIHVYMSG